MSNSETDNKAGQASLSGKKPWVRPSAETTPARGAAVTGGGTGDGASCHS